MKVVITKQPREEYLDNKTFSISQREFEILRDKTIKSQIEVYDQEQQLVKKIPQSKYSKLKMNPRTVTDDMGNQVPIFVVSFAGV